MLYQLKTTDLQNFESKTQIAGQFGNGISKSLNIKTAITSNNEAYSLFTVENHNKVIFSHSNLELAINAYNSISSINTDEFSPEKWLKVNYNLKPMQILRGFKAKDGWIIKTARETDNIGHFRTNYPVVLEIYNINNENETITLEQLFGY